MSENFCSYCLLQVSMRNVAYLLIQYSQKTKLHRGWMAKRNQWSFEHRYRRTRVYTLWEMAVVNNNMFLSHQPVIQDTTEIGIDCWLNNSKPCLPSKEKEMQKRVREMLYRGCLGWEVEAVYTIKSSGWNNIKVKLNANRSWHWILRQDLTSGNTH